MAAGPPTLVPMGPHRLTFGHKTYIMGIINMTPDSFSGTGLDRDQEAALERARAMVRDGADIIDIGGESSARRHYGPVPASEEIERICPVIERLTRELDVPVSVDTWKAAVARAALKAGAHMINDVGGFLRDSGIVDVAVEAGCPIVLMHSRADTRSPDIMAELKHFFRDRLAWARGRGLREEQVIIDAGFWFGKSIHQDLLVTRRLREFTAFGRPILHAPSRKPAIAHVLGRPDSVDNLVMGTAAAVVVGIVGGADIVRVHEVREMAECARMADALLRGYAGPDADAQFR